MLLSFSILFHPSSFCFEKSVFSGNNKGIKLFSANFAVLAIFASLKHLYRSGCISIFQLHIKVLSSSNTCKGHNAVYHCAKSSPSASYLTYTPLTLRSKKPFNSNRCVQNRGGKTANNMEVKGKHFSFWIRLTAVYSKPTVLLCVQYISYSCWPKRLHLLPFLLLPPSRLPTILLSLNAPKRWDLYVKGLLLFFENSPSFCSLHFCCSHKDNFAIQ